MLRWPQMMFHMITIIEEEEIVEPAIMAHSPAHMFVMPLELAQTKTQSQARQIGFQQEVWCPPGESAP